MTGRFFKDPGTTTADSMNKNRLRTEETGSTLKGAGVLHPVFLTSEPKKSGPKPYRHSIFAGSKLSN
jgi:hypothetical protein